MSDIPRRLSVSDPGFDSEMGRRLDVLLNGTVRDQVIAYDMDARTITRYVTDERGNIVVAGDEAKRETLTGDVAVRWRDCI